MFSMGWYPKPRLQSGITLVVLVGAGPGSPKNADAFFGVPRKPALVRHSRCVRLIRAQPLRTSTAQLMTAILSQRACGTRAGLKPAPTSFATARRSPPGVGGTLVICDTPAPAEVGFIRLRPLKSAELGYPRVQAGEGLSYSKSLCRGTSRRLQ